MVIQIASTFPYYKSDYAFYTDVIVCIIMIIISFGKFSGSLISGAYVLKIKGVMYVSKT